MCVSVCRKSGGNEVTLSFLRYLQPSVNALAEEKKKWTVAYTGDKKKKEKRKKCRPEL